MRGRTAVASLIGLVVLTGCSSGSNPGRTTSSSTTTPTPTSEKGPPAPGESVTNYAEHVLPQTPGTLQSVGEAGLLAISDVNVCAPQGASARRVVRAADFQLVLVNGRHISASVGAISPKLRDGIVPRGTCEHGFVNWRVAPGQDPLILDVRTSAIWQPHCPEVPPAADPCIDRAPKRLRSTFDDESIPPVPKGFVGAWFAHGIGATIDSTGRGTLTWRTYALCGEDPPPCDTFAGSSILDGGHAVLRLALTGAMPAVGDVLSTTDPGFVPSGVLTARVDEGTHELFLKPSSTAEIRLCSTDSPSGDCGA